MKRKIDPEQPFVGIYRLGMTNVEVYGVTKMQGGMFYCVPDDLSLPRVKIGFNYDRWWEVVNVLLHESFEFLAAQRGVRMVPCGACQGASDSYRFIMDHNDMTNICDEQAYFISKCLPDLATVWKTYRPKRG